MAKLLIAEDDPEIAMLERDYLEMAGYEVSIVDNGQHAVTEALNGGYSLILLDLMLPGCSGYDVCRLIRDKIDVPILMVTARTESVDKIRGLGLGADDYIAKPFDPAELVARVKAQLRRYQRYNPARAAPEPDVLEQGGLWMDVKTHQCQADGRPLALTPTEFSILRILLENKGRVVSGEELFHQIWQDEYYTKSNNTITVHIRHLREKLGPGAGYIKTVWGVGYQIET